MIGATKALAIELAKRHITVNCVAPGLIDTDMLGEHVPQEEILKMIPMQRSGTGRRSRRRRFLPDVRRRGVCHASGARRERWALLT